MYIYIANLYWISGCGECEEHLSPRLAIVSFRAITVEADSRRRFVTAEKTKPKKGPGRRRGWGNHSVCAVGARPECGRLHRAESNCSVKCERHTIAALKSRRRRAVAQLQSMTRGGRWNNLSGGAAHHRQGRRRAKVVCSKTERPEDMGFRWAVSAGSI